jgi:hypothetical protein
VLRASADDAILHFFALLTRLWSARCAEWTEIVKSATKAALPVASMGRLPMITNYLFEDRIALKINSAFRS